jgi:pimeloyl-ACP methyl ester carboxylesterase
MESGYIETDGTRIYYEAAGHGPVILFIHAGVADSRMWRGQMEIDGHRSIVFDQRGFGKTTWVPGPYSNRADSLTVLDHLGVTEAVVVGCSNCGEAAMQLAIVAPERVSGLVLVGASPGGWEPETGWDDDPLWDEAVAAYETGDLAEAAGADARLWLAGAGRRVEDLDHELVELFYDMDLTPLSIETERDEHVVTFEPPTNDRLGSISAPTLAVVGEFDFPDLHMAASYLADRLSGGDPVTIAGAAHLPSLERPTDFNKVLKAFLAV